MKFGVGTVGCDPHVHCTVGIACGKSIQNLQDRNVEALVSRDLGTVGPP